MALHIIGPESDQAREWQAPKGALGFLHIHQLEDWGSQPALEGHRGGIPSPIALLRGSTSCLSFFICTTEIHCLPPNMAVKATWLGGLHTALGWD